MRIILIYLLLFTFWAELALGFKLSQLRGLSLFNLCTYFLILAWIFTIMTKKRFYESNELNIYIVLLSLVVFLSIPIKYLLGEISNISLIEELSMFKQWVSALILFFVLFNIIDDEKTLKATIFGLIILLAVTALTAPLTSIGILKIGHASTSFKGRASGFGGVNSFAAYLVMFIPLVMTYFLFQKKVMPKAASAVLLALTFVAIVTTGSRGGMLSFLFGMGIFLYLLHGQEMIRIQGIIAIIVTVLIIGSISFALAPSQPKDILKNRFDTNSTEGGGLDEYTAGRTLFWRKGILLFFESPIYGHGQRSFQPLVRKYGVNAVAHNTYLTYLVEHGIIGFALFLMILVKIFKLATKHLKETVNSWDKLFYISYLSGFCGYHFALLAINESQPRYIFWIYTAVFLKYYKIRNV